MIYTRDLLPGWTTEAREKTWLHVRDHLASVADADDDPASYADRVRLSEFSGDDGSLRIVGELDAEPQAPYLQPGYDPDAAERAGL